MRRSTGTTGAAVARSVLIKAPADEVFDAFRSEERLRIWYFDDARVDFRVGGHLAFSGPEGSVTAIYKEISPTRIVTDYNPPWWGRVVWTISTERNGTRVALRHEGFEGREDWIDRFAWGWEAFLKSLKAHLEGRPVK